MTPRDPCTNATCMPSGMETLYCTHCDKTYRVAPEAIRLMRRHGKTVSGKPGAYRYEAGCFFKELAALKRKEAQK